MISTQHVGTGPSEGATGSGGFTDQTIEQMLIRMLKVRGGLAHGRGIISYTTCRQAKYVHFLLQTVPVCDSLE